MDPHRVWVLARFARSLIGSALRGPLRATHREALRFVGANLPVRCRLRTISLRCYVMARSAVLSADTRCLRAAPLARSLPLPICRLHASPCRTEGAKGAAPPGWSVVPKATLPTQICRCQLARSLSLALHLTTLLRDGPVRRPQRRYPALAGGSACPVAAAPSWPVDRITLSRRGR